MVIVAMSNHIFSMRFYSPFFYFPSFMKPFFLRKLHWPLPNFAMKTESMICDGVSISDPTHVIDDTATAAIGSTAGSAKLMPTLTASASAHGMPVETTQNPAVAMVVSAKITMLELLINCHAIGSNRLKNDKNEIITMIPETMAKS